MLISCDKTEEVYIEGNVAPPDETIENVIIENYLNKLYISLLGRKATDEEFSAGDLGSPIKNLPPINLRARTH